MITEPCVTAGKVAEHMSVLKESVYRWRNERACARKESRWKFELSEVDEWVRDDGAEEPADGDFAE